MTHITAILYTTLCLAQHQDQFHGESMAEWTADLSAEAPKVRSRAAWSLGKIGPAAAPAIPSLIAALEDRSRDVRDDQVHSVMIGALAHGEADPSFLGRLALTTRAGPDRKIARCSS